MYAAARLVRRYADTQRHEAVEGASDFEHVPQSTPRRFAVEMLARLHVVREGRYVATRPGPCPCPCHIISSCHAMPFCDDAR
jgi:hypothetical protein